MAIRNDYILDMIAQFVQAVVEAAERARAGEGGRAIAQYEEVVGRALDMDAEAILSLTPESLVTLVQLSAVDESLAVYAAYSLVGASRIYEAQGNPLGELRAGQARAIAGAYGFDVGEVPPEVVQTMEENGL